MVDMLIVSKLQDISTERITWGVMTDNLLDCSEVISWPGVQMRIGKFLDVTCEDQVLLSTRIEMEINQIWCVIEIVCLQWSSSNMEKINVFLLQ